MQPFVIKQQKFHNDDNWSPWQQNKPTADEDLKVHVQALEKASQWTFSCLAIISEGQEWTFSSFLLVYSVIILDNEQPAFNCSAGLM